MPRYALLISNSDYQDATLRQLIAPQADADALATVLRDPAIGNFKSVDILANATAATARDALADFFADKRRTDLLLLYFTGHGILDNRGDLLLAATDTRTTRPRANAISAEFIVREMDECRSNRQLLILDCCNSGRVRQGITARNPQADKLDTGSRFEGNKSRGRVIITASDQLQAAYEGNVIEGQGVRSFFSHYLVEGLRDGKADSNRDGHITVNEWYDYAHDQMVANAVAHTPMIWTYGRQGKLTIASAPVQPTITIAERSVAEKLVFIREMKSMLADPDMGAIVREQFALYTEDENPLVRRLTEAALKPSTFLASLRVKDGAVRAEAAIALGNLGELDDATVTALLRLYNTDSEDVVRHAALHALLACGQAALVGMVFVPAGEFLMGSTGENAGDDDEKPQHRVYLPDYFIDKTPVTNAHYRQFIQSGGYANPDYWVEALEAGYWSDGTCHGQTQSRYWDDQEWNGAQQPVVEVSWYEALAYARWAGKRLPTEAQWEKAARGTDGRIYPWGNAWDKTRLNSGRDIGTTTSVGQFSPQGDSPYGAVDMVGNVWEWCITDGGYPYPYTPDDGREDISGGDDFFATLRGGSWYDWSGICRAAYRSSGPLHGRDDGIGFRLVVYGRPSQGR